MHNVYAYLGVNKKNKFKNETILLNRTSNYEGVIVSIYILSI